MSMLVPTVSEQTAKGERLVDLYSRLLGSRIVFLGTEINETSANLVIAQLLHLDAEAPGRDIWLYLNSPGGDMVELFGIYDTMQFLESDVATVCVGQACSAAAVLLAAGTKGKRYVLPNARVLIHQPHGGAQGQSTDLERAVAEMVELRKRMIDVLVEATGRPVKRITEDIDRDYILRGDDAVAYGLVDAVLPSRKAAARAS
ncbi:MAG TPA: ATP-dependent Clp protease proteolytic subunit [Acidimicrobiales bacterium]|jgi:ATP-dependent Clp protease protease subunit|nr:ATP-dependent Clp protease proteolytic subunit [Acidimicrobiales bacterium]